MSQPCRCKNDANYLLGHTWSQSCLCSRELLWQRQGLDSGCKYRYMSSPGFVLTLLLQVGGAYDATIGDNLLPRGTSAAAIREMIALFNLANSKCPSAKVVAGGYSQGAALAAASIEDLSTSVRDKVVGTVLFGYTKNLQNLGRIPNYPRERTKVFCNIGDLVCTGSLIVAAPHLAYQSDASGPAPEFLIQRVAASN